MPTAPIDPSDVARLWSARGYSCDEWVDQPGQVWADYKHAVDELVMIVSGELEVEVDGVCHRPAIGVELHIPAGALHTVRTLGENEARWLYGYASR